MEKWFFKKNLCQHHHHKWWKQWTNFMIFYINLHRLSSIEFEFNSVKVKFNLRLKSHDQQILLLLLLHNLSLLCGLLAEFLPSLICCCCSRMWTWSCLDKKISSMLDTNLGSQTRYAFLTSVLWQNMCNTLNKSPPTTKCIVNRCSKHWFGKALKSWSKGFIWKSSITFITQNHQDFK